MIYSPEVGSSIGLGWSKTQVMLFSTLPSECVGFAHGLAFPYGFKMAVTIPGIIIGYDIT